jgi:hypothetical protein
MNTRKAKAIGVFHNNPAKRKEGMVLQLSGPITWVMRRGALIQKSYIGVTFASTEVFDSKVAAMPNS